jgi:hypothetical protein
LAIGPSILIYIYIYILIENQQMYQNDHFIVMSSQTLLHVSAYQRHHQGAHMSLTSYLYVGVHYKNNNGVSTKLAPVRIVTLWIQVVMANCCWSSGLLWNTPVFLIIATRLRLSISNNAFLWFINQSCALIPHLVHTMCATFNIQNIQENKIITLLCYYFLHERV